MCSHPGTEIATHRHRLKYRLRENKLTTTTFDHAINLDGLTAGQVAMFQTAIDLLRDGVEMAEACERSGLGDAYREVQRTMIQTVGDLLRDGMSLADACDRVGLGDGYRKSVCLCGASVVAPSAWPEFVVCTSCGWHR